ncbi:hypothetical protein C2E23DRAFT_312666 [Lenzites betulinus]|nr:hypothetical protein C2E23DRAFT_312666 [Lenzites betulinus]
MRLCSPATLCSSSHCPERYILGVYVNVQRPTFVSTLKSAIGAILIGTFLSLILYGVTVHQVYSYFRVYTQDRTLIKAFVICMFVVETFHMTTCIHICYTVLVTNYFNISAFSYETFTFWSGEQVAAHIMFVMAQSFYERRAALLSPKTIPVITVAVLLSIATLGFAVAETVRCMNPISCQKYQWLVSAALGSAVASDVLTTGVLIIVLRNSRTGMKGTNRIIDRVILYSVNTGLLTGVLHLIGLILILVNSNLMSSGGILIVVSQVYPNSVLAAHLQKSASPSPLSTVT